MKSEIIKLEKRVWGESQNKICECGVKIDHVAPFSDYCQKCEDEILAEELEYYGKK
ncbi:MAG: hypothetical protein GY757_18980 [bacterium]|nr:hypothetical protein [bacterium]